MDSFYKNKTILVTGGSGSIGSELARKIVNLKPQSLRIFDNNETALFEIEEELRPIEEQEGRKIIRTLIGDVRDKERLERALEGVDIVFHAAALKHVPLCEFNPFDAVKTNVIGTQNVLDAALNQNVEKFILVSTDKAVNPINVMGTTKLLAERLTISANSYGPTKRTKFSCVRFGNVLNSRGSVVPIFQRQLAHGGPITITDPTMTRFIMRIPDAAELILKAGEQAEGGEIFILKMPAVQIDDLAEVMIEEIAKNPEEIETVLIGKRVNEKMYEELMTQEEAIYAVEKEDLFIINSSKEPTHNDIEYNSHTIDRLSKDEIKLILREIL